MTKNQIIICLFKFYLNKTKNCSTWFFKNNFRRRWFPAHYRVRLFKVKCICSYKFTSIDKSNIWTIQQSIRYCLTRFGPKMGQIGPKWYKSGTFQIRFQYIWLDEPNVLKYDLKKSRICPICGRIWPTLEPNLPSLDWIGNKWFLGLRLIKIMRG